MSHLRVQIGAKILFYKHKMSCKFHELYLTENKTKQSFIVYLTENKTAFFLFVFYFFPFMHIKHMNSRRQDFIFQKAEIKPKSLKASGLQFRGEILQGFCVL